MNWHLTVDSIRNNPSDLLDQYVYRTDRFRLESRNSAAGETSFYLVSIKKHRENAVNSTAALILDYCREPILVSDLLQELLNCFPETPSLETDVLGVLDEYHKAGVVNFRSERHPDKHYALDYQPVPGERSAKAERLVDFCLGDFKDAPVSKCTRDPVYLNNRPNLMIFETHAQCAVLSAGIEMGVRDQKRIVSALISQRAKIPPGLRCWLVRGDGAGHRSIPEQGLHISGMRRAIHRHLVLVPTACRDRYLGPNLERQMEDLEKSWVPWEEKSDTAWWGGALTGLSWRKQEPRTLTRLEVLEYFRDNPSDQVRLHLALSPDQRVPSGVELRGKFTKKSAFTNKCLVLLPGNDIASASSWYFCGNSVVLMPRPHLEHILYFEMNPWEHYVPLENDPADILVKLRWVLENEEKAREIVDNSHQRLRWLYGPEYLWACNEVLRRIAEPGSSAVR
ncbi:glycosyl transferase family 90 [Gammaproteobacteria bacterium]|nr:glycosyl transferase family 90 [Gammaproteobacteria bacterium]